MITQNAIGGMSGSLLALIPQLTEKARSHAEFESGDQDIVDGVVKVLTEATLLMEELRLAEESIATNLTLSTLGQQEALAKVAKDIHGRAKKIEKAASQRREAVESERKAIFDIPKMTGDATVSLMREQEQRVRLKALPLSGKMRAYADAVHRKEPSLVRAVKDPAFIGETLADKAFADFVQRVDTEAVEFGQPMQWARLQSLEKAAQWLTLLWSAIDLQFSGYVKMPVFKTPPIGQMDLGMQNHQQAPVKSTAADKAVAV